MEGPVSVPEFLSGASCLMDRAVVGHNGASLLYELSLFCPCMGGFWGRIPSALKIAIGLSRGSSGKQAFLALAVA